MRDTLSQENNPVELWPSSKERTPLDFGLLRLTPSLTIVLAIGQSLVCCQKNARREVHCVLTLELGCRLPACNVNQRVLLLPHSRSDGVQAAKSSMPSNYCTAVLAHVLMRIYAYQVVPGASQSFS